MAAYLIATCRGVTNPEGLKQYWAHARPTFEGFGAELLAAYSPFTLLEGKGPVEGVVIVQFPSLDVAKRWYESPAYQAVKRHRDGAADFEIVFVEGGIVPSEKRMPHLMGG
jgi:uncharacterized protein (DUF1330 family)